MLFITPHAFNKSTGTGITFTNLFAGWPKDSIATIHDDTFPVSTDICNRYFCLSGREIRRLDFGLSTLSSRNIRSADVPETESPASRAPRRQAGLKIRARQLVFGDGLPQKGILTPQLTSWIEDFKPDLIFTILGSIGMMELIEGIQHRFELPLIVHMMDDWPSAQFRRGLLAPFQRRRMESLVQNLIDRASVRIGICDAMCEVFAQRYGQPFIPFQNTVDARRWHPGATDPTQMNDPIRVVYAGSVLSHAQSDSLVDCCQAVAQLADSGIRIGLDIYSPDVLVEAHRHRLEANPAVKIHPTLTEDREFFATLAAADVLLMPCNFDADSVRFIRYSMPTRVPAYLATGTPILVYGPAETAQASYARDAGWGLVVDRRGVLEVEWALRRLMEDFALRRELSATALRTAADRHDSRRVRGQFREALFVVASRRP